MDEPNLSLLKRKEKRGQNCVKKKEGRGGYTTSSEGFAGQRKQTKTRDENQCGEGRTRRGGKNEMMISRRFERGGREAQLSHHGYTK